MRFANIGILFIGGFISVCLSTSAAPWQIWGRTALEVQLPDAQAATRIAKFNQKLTEIIPRLNSDRSWFVDVRTTRVRRGKTIQVKSALIKLEGYNLIFITEADAIAQGFGSVTDLAETWRRSLSETFSDPKLRKLLAFGIEMPSEVNYRGVTYYLKAQIARDRGLFRTSGDRTMGKIIYWEVPADSKAYQIADIKSLEPKSPPSEIFLLNRRQQFLSYAQERS